MKWKAIRMFPMNIMREHCPLIVQYVGFVFPSYGTRSTSLALGKGRFVHSLSTPTISLQLACGT